jgi:hypothetical protein
MGWWSVMVGCGVTPVVESASPTHASAYFLRSGMEGDDHLAVEELTSALASEIGGGKGSGKGAWGGKGKGGGKGSALEFELDAGEGGGIGDKGAISDEVTTNLNNDDTATTEGHAAADDVHAATLEGVGEGAGETAGEGPANPVSVAVSDATASAAGDQVVPGTEKAAAAAADATDVDVLATNEGEDAALTSDETTVASAVAAHGTTTATTATNDDIGNDDGAGNPSTPSVDAALESGVVADEGPVDT